MSESALEGLRCVVANSKTLDIEAQICSPVLVFVDTCLEPLAGGLVVTLGHLKVWTGDVDASRKSRISSPLSVRCERDFYDTFLLSFDAAQVTALWFSHGHSEALAALAHPPDRTPSIGSAGAARAPYGRASPPASLHRGTISAGSGGSDAARATRAGRALDARSPPPDPAAECGGDGDDWMYRGHDPDDTASEGTGSAPGTPLTSPAPVTPVLGPLRGSVALHHPLAAGGRDGCRVDVRVPEVAAAVGPDAVRVGLRLAGAVSGWLADMGVEDTPPLCSADVALAVGPGDGPRPCRMAVWPDKIRFRPRAGPPVVVWLRAGLRCELMSAADPDPGPPSPSSGSATPAPLTSTAAAATHTPSSTDHNPQPHTTSGGARDDPPPGPGPGAALGASPAAPTAAGAPDTVWLCLPPSVPDAGPPLRIRHDSAAAAAATRACVQQCAFDLAEAARRHEEAAREARDDDDDAPYPAIDPPEADPDGDPPGPGGPSAANASVTLSVRVDRVGVRLDCFAPRGDGAAAAPAPPPDCVLAVEMDDGALMLRLRPSDFRCETHMAALRVWDRLSDVQVLQVTPPRRDGAGPRARDPAPAAAAAGGDVHVAFPDAASGRGLVTGVGLRLGDCEFEAERAAVPQLLREVSGLLDVCEEEVARWVRPTAYGLGAGAGAGAGPPAPDGAGGGDAPTAARWSVRVAAGRCSGGLLNARRPVFSVTMASSTVGLGFGEDGLEVSCARRWGAGAGTQSRVGPGLGKGGIAAQGMSGLQVRGGGGSIEPPKSVAGGGFGNRAQLRGTINQLL